MNKQYIDFVPSSRGRNDARRVSSTRKKGVNEASVIVTASSAARISRVRGSQATVTVVETNSDVSKSQVGARGGKTSLERDEAAIWRQNKENRGGNTVEFDKRASINKNEGEAFAAGDSPKLGVVEDYNPKFVNKNVPKRPLHNETTAYATVSEASGKIKKEQSQNDLAKVKAQKVKRGLFGGKKKVDKKIAAAKISQKPIQAEAVVKTNEPKSEIVKESLRVSQAPRAARSPFINQEKVVKRPLSKNVYQKTTSSVKEEPKGPVTIIANNEKESKMGLLVVIILTIILGAAAGTVAFLLLPK